MVAIDYAGFLKKGVHSARLARQYSGTFGRIANCQVGGFLVYSDFHNRTLLDWECYMLEVWITVQLRPCKVGCSPDTPYSPRPELVRHMLEQLLDAGVPVAWVMGTRSMVTPVTWVAGRRRRPTLLRRSSPPPAADGTPRQESNRTDVATH